MGDHINQPITESPFGGLTADRLADGDLRLRCWQTTDLEVAVLAAADPLIFRYRYSLPHRLDDAAGWLDQINHDLATGERLELAITEHGVIVGSVSLTDLEHGNAMVRYWLLPQARGRGVATRAVTLIATYALRYLGLGRLGAYVEPDNTASAAVLERTGFKLEGRLREHLKNRDGHRVDTLLYGLIPTDLKHTAPAAGEPNRLFDRYQHSIAQLPNRPLTTEDLLTDTFLLHKDGDLASYYIPFERNCPAAQLVLIGITPGFTQMRIAYETARDGLNNGLDPETIYELVDQKASFAGAMRTNLTTMLNDLGLPALLNITDTAELFAGRAELMHSTSALRNPVFINGQNYTGSAPPITTKAILRDTIINDLGPELTAVPQAILIPLGNAATQALQLLIDTQLIDQRRCLLGFPHPSGANGHRHRQLQQARANLAQQLEDWFRTTPADTRGSAH